MTNRVRIGMTLNAASLSAFNVEAEVKKKIPGLQHRTVQYLSRDIETALRERKYDFAIGRTWDSLRSSRMTKFIGTPIS